MAKTQHMTIEKWFFLLLSGLIIWLFWTVIEPFAMVILMATVAAIILAPVDRLLNKSIKHPKLSAGLLTAAVLLLVFVPLLLVLTITATQATDLIQGALEDGGIAAQVDPEPSLWFAALPEQAQEQILAIDVVSVSKSAATWVFDNIGDVFSSTTKFVLNTFIFFISLFYLISERSKIYDEVLALSPLRDSIDAKILKRVIMTVRSVVFGVLILAIIQGVLAGIGMTIFGVPGAFIWGGLTIIAALVPIIGTALVIVPVIGWLFFTGSVGAALGLLIWAIVIVSFADNFIGPYLIQGTTKMHTLLVLLTVLGGLHAMGPIGVLAGPTILAALLALIELYKSGILTTGNLK